MPLTATRAGLGEEPADEAHKPNRVLPCACVHMEERVQCVREHPCACAQECVRVRIHACAHREERVRVRV
jgi:hypothetical protein